MKFYENRGKTRWCSLIRMLTSSSPCSACEEVDGCDKSLFRPELLLLSLGLWLIFKRYLTIWQTQKSLRSKIQIRPLSRGRGVFRGCHMTTRKWALNRKLIVQRRGRVLASESGPFLACAMAGVLEKRERKIYLDDTTPLTVAIVTNRMRDTHVVTSKN